MKTLDFLRIYFRLFYIQACWNYERMLSLGLAFCLIPFAKRYIQDDVRKREFLTRSLSFFNTHPYMASWLVGAILRSEEQAADAPMSAKSLERHKRQLSIRLAGLGDEMFWRLLKPIAAMAGVVVSFFDVVAGLIVFAAGYNTPHFFIRLKGLLTGYREGFVGVERAVASGVFQSAIRYLTRGAAVLTGVLAAVGLTRLEAPMLTSGFAMLSGGGLMWVLLKRGWGVAPALVVLTCYSIVLSVIADYIMTA